jgi:hypothetical protein
MFHVKQINIWKVKLQLVSRETLEMGQDRGGIAGDQAGTKDQESP